MLMKVLSNIIDLTEKDHQMFVDKVEKFCSGKKNAMATYNPIVYLGENSIGHDRGYISALVHYELNS